MFKNYHFKLFFTTILSIIVVNLLFIMLFNFDNKYAQSNNYIKNDVFCINEKDLDKPLFLIDGWKLSVNGNPYVDTYIGEYANFSFVPGCSSTFGTAIYHLDLKYEGSPTILTLEIPEIFTDYTLVINGETVATKGSGNLVNFIADENTSIEIHVSNYTHYYSGVYYPPAIGTIKTISNIHFFKNLVYSFVCITSLLLFFFSLILIINKQETNISFHFGFLCLAVFFYCIHPFIWQLGINNTFWYLIEDLSRVCIWTETFVISLIITDLWKYTNLKKFTEFTSIIICAFILLSLAILIPNTSSFVHVYGHIMNLIGVTSWLILSIITGIGIVKKLDIFCTFTITGCFIMGISVLNNFLFNNKFEPIYTLWQSEWAYLLVVFVYLCALLLYHIQIVKENKKMKEDLEQLVEQRTKQLSSVIEERKQFFSDMAHNLKAPISAIHGFLDLIKKQAVGIDDELLGYIAIIESENIEMQRRVQSLNKINEFDRIRDSKIHLNIDDLLDEIEECNKPDAEVYGISLIVNRLNKDKYIFAQKEKINIVFENLIYNSFSFTPENGYITITPYLEDNYVIFTVEDTGSGISPEKLPHIFERFFTGRENGNEGSGLGLYIVKLSIEELNGSITVASKPGTGTTFKIKIPLSKNYDI